ncbi:hypothetical protein SEA_HAGER_1 [Microbacterium phage Hager]|nr:hypothetical protein SEA_HAGER_1 [Microbacterium phage Hager]
MGTGTRSPGLSKASPYEQLFGTRYRRVGRPSGDSLEESPYRDPSGGQLDPLLLSVAKRRAQTVVLEEQRERLSAVFAAELKVLRRRGVEAVAADVGVDLAKRNKASEEA